MENYIMVDCDWLRSIVDFHCTISKEGGNITWWAKQDCGYKFLVVDDLLIIGAINDHSLVYATWTLRDESLSEDIRHRAEVISTEQWQNGNWRVRGAGNIGINGQITSWKSVCYEVETPQHMRVEITKEIERLFSSGALTPR